MELKFEHILIGLLVLFLLYTLVQRKSENFDCQGDSDCQTCLDDTCVDECKDDGDDCEKCIIDCQNE